MSKKRFGKEEPCFRLDTLDEIQKAFNQMTSQAKLDNRQLGELSQRDVHRFSEFTHQDIYKTPSRYKQTMNSDSSESDDLSQIIEYNDEIKEPKEKPKKVMNLVLKNGQLIKIGEQEVKNTNKQLTAYDLNVLQEIAKRKASMHSKARASSAHINSEAFSRGRGVSQEKNKQIQQQENKDQNRMSQLVESYGEVLISTIIQSLMVHKLRSSEYSEPNSSFFSSVSSTTGHLSSEIIKEFGISIETLRQFDTFEEQREYIILQMEGTLSKLVSNFKQKIKDRDKQYKEEEKNIYKTNGYHQRNDPRYLDWLKIESQYDGVNLKLREMVVASMNQILDRMKEKGAKVNDLINFVGVDTGLMLQQEQQQHLDPLNLLNKMINKGSEHDEWIKEIEETIQVMKWDEEEEEKFQNNIRQFKKLQSSAMKLTNGQSLGFSENIYRKMKEEQQVENRELLLNKYQDGEVLTSQQMQFLANTSRLLNGCVDKVYEQEKANTLSKDLISNIELKIAENIIYQYYKVKKGLQILRNEYLQHKAKKDAINLQNNKDMSQHKQICEQNKQYHQRMAKVFRSYLSLKKKKPTDNIEDLSYSTQVLVKAFSSKLKLKRAISLNSNSNGNQDHSRNDQNKINITALQNNFFNSKSPSPIKGDAHNNLSNTEKKSKQNDNQVPRVGIPKSKSLESRIKSSQHHPPSKLFAYEDHLKPFKQLRDDSDIRGFRRFYNSKKYDQKQLEQYDLKIVDHPHLKNKLQFISYYSKGPGKLIPEREKVHYTDVKRPTKRIVEATIMIQRFIRGFLGRMRVRKIKQKKIWDLQNKISLQQKRFMNRTNQNGQPHNLENQSILKGGGGSSSVLFQRAESKSSLKLKKPYFILDSKKKDSSFDGQDDSKSKISLTSSQRSKYKNQIIQMKMMNMQSASPQKLNSTVSNQHLHKQNSLNSKVSEKKRSISQSQLQQIKTDLLRSKLSSIIAAGAGEGERKRELQKLNKQFQQLNKEGMDSKLLQENLSNNNSPSSNEDKKSISKTEKKRIQQRKQTLFRGVLNNDLNYLCLVGHRWEKGDFNSKDKHLNTPMYYACQKNSIPIIKWLFSQGADMNIICGDGNAPLHLLFQLNNLELIQYIIKEEDRVNLNIRNRLGQTPLALCKQEILTSLGLEKAITVVQEQTKRMHFDNNKLFYQNKSIDFEEKLISDQSYLIMQNFNVSEQKSNFNHMASQRYLKKKSNLSIQSSISSNFVNTNRNNL